MKGHIPFLARNGCFKVADFLYFLEQDFPSVVVVGLGKKTAGVDEQENWHEGKENIRVAVAGSLTFEVYC